MWLLKLVGWLQMVSRGAGLFTQTSQLSQMYPYLVYNTLSIITLHHAMLIVSLYFSKTKEESSLCDG